MSRLPPVAGVLLLLAQAPILIAQSPDPRIGADSRRAIVFVIDDLNIEFRDTIRIRQLVRSLGHRLVRDGDLYGIVSTGESSIDLDLTSNSALMDPAVMRIVGNGLKPQEIMQPDAVNQIARRGQLAFSTMQNQVARLESTQSSRKVVVLISNGWDLDRSVESINELDDVAREGAREKVAFCTIDPRGLGSGSQRKDLVDPNQWAPHLQRQQNNLRSLAENTGGVSLTDAADFNGALERIFAVAAP